MDEPDNMKNAHFGQGHSSGAVCMDSALQTRQGDGFQHTAALTAGLRSGAPLQRPYNSFDYSGGQGTGSCQIGQAASTAPSYSIGGNSTAAAEGEHNSRTPNSTAQLSQVIGESKSTGKAQIGTLDSSQQAQYPALPVPVSLPALVALPGEVMGSITLPVVNLSQFPVAVGQSGLCGSPMPVSPLASSPTQGRFIGETAMGKGSGGAAVLSAGSSTRSVGAAPSLGVGVLDSSTAAMFAQQDQLVAQQEQLLGQSAAKQHVLHEGAGRSVGSPVGVVGVLHGEDIGEHSSVGQSGDAAKERPSTSPGQPKVFYGGAENKGQRDYQQDRHTIIEHLEPHVSIPGAGAEAAEQMGLAAVFDGHKRCQAAELAHKRLSELLSREPGLFGANKGSSRDDVCEAIVRSFKTLDKEILEDARQSNIKDCQYGGTTALLALRSGRVLYVAHTGDSGAVMACSAYDLDFPLRLTTDHKPNRPDEHARITRAGGNIDESRDRVVSDPKPHNDRVILLNMSRSLGDPQFKRGKGEHTVECMPEVRRIELQPGDTALVLASDGLWTKVSDTTAISVLNKVRAKSTAADGKTAKAAAQALVDEALKQGTHDNVTAVVMLFKWS